MIARVGQKPCRDRRRSPPAWRTCSETLLPGTGGPDCCSSCLTHQLSPREAPRRIGVEHVAEESSVAFSVGAREIASGETARKRVENECADAPGIRRASRDVDFGR
jgi:hypothetical protein